MLDLLTAPLAAAMLLQAPATPELAQRTLEPGAGSPTVSILALGRRPELQLGETQHAVAQVCREVEDWSVFLTRYDPAVFRAFEVWADEQYLWIKEEFDAPQARLFVRRGTPAAAALAAATSYDRLELQLVVREMHAGRAWVEVTGARWSPHQTPKGSLLHAIRALELMERDGWTLAVGQLDRALAPDLPAHARAELERLRDECTSEIDALARD